VKKATGKGSTLIKTGKTAPVASTSKAATPKVLTARQAAAAQKTNPALAQALLSSKGVRTPALDDINCPVKVFT